MDLEQLCYLFFILILASLIIPITRKKKLQPPGPWRLPFIGNLYLLDPKKPHRSLLTLSIKHGPLMLLHLGSIPTLVISSHTVAEEIFRNHDLIFSGRPPLAAAKKLLYNLSSLSFSPYGDHWREARKITVLKLLSHRRVQTFEAVRCEEVTKLMDAIKELKVVNLSELTLSLANNVVCRVVLGDEYGGGYRRDGGVWLHEVLSEAQRLLGGFWVGEYIPIMGWVDRFLLNLHARLEKNFEEFNRIYDKAIGEHLNNLREDTVMEEKSSDGGNQQREDLLHSLLRLHKVAAVSHHGGFLSSIDHVKGILAESFIAGTDTSSSTIVWTMTELMRNPRVMLKLQQELQQVAHSKNIDEHMLIQEKELKKLDYLEQVIKESLRLHPPAPLLLQRETIEPCVIFGYTISAKTRVLINATAISTDPKVWEKPLEFNPERFQDSEVDYKGQHFEYLPFGAGRRKCPGMSFAIVLVQLAIANLVHSFEWSLPNGTKIEDINMEEAPGITVHKKEPLILVAKSKW